MRTVTFSEKMHETKTFQFLNVLKVRANNTRLSLKSNKLFELSTQCSQALKHVKRHRVLLTLLIMLLQVSKYVAVRKSDFKHTDVTVSTPMSLVNN